MSLAASPEPGRAVLNGVHRTLELLDQQAGCLPPLKTPGALPRDLAGWLLADVIGRTPGAPDLTAAAERILQRLSPSVSRLLSPSGEQAILSRALHLAQAEFPFLAAVHAGVPPGVSLAGLPEVVRRVEAVEASMGVLAVLTSLLGLLATFIGEDLMLRLVREEWPNLPFPGGVSGNHQLPSDRKVASA